MRLARIKNKYLYNGDEPEGEHTYAIYYDRKTQRYRAIQLTHIYEMPKQKKHYFYNGYIMLEQFNEFVLPSGVRDRYFDETTSKKKIDLHDAEVVAITRRHLPIAQANRIKAFATIKEAGQPFPKRKNIKPKNNLPKKKRITGKHIK